MDHGPGGLRDRFLIMRVGAKTARDDPGGSLSRPVGSLNGPTFTTPWVARSVMTGPPPVCDGDLSIRQASRLIAGSRAVLTRTPAGYGKSPTPIFAEGCWPQVCRRTDQSPKS